MSEKRERYHHGNLREVLIQAAIDLIGEDGASALTLREVARRANVSHGAPYRHFESKAALVAAVSEQGFRKLHVTIEQATRGIEDGGERLRAAGFAYVVFAVDHPAHYRTMFGHGGTANEEDGAFPDLEEASSTAFEQLITMVTAAQEDGAVRSGAPETVALMVWSQVHGLASLAIDGLLKKFDPMTMEEMLGLTSEMLFSGIKTG